MGLCARYPHVADDGTAAFCRPDAQGVPLDKLPGKAFFHGMTWEHVEEFNRPAFGLSEGACALWHAAADLREATLRSPVPLLNPKLMKKALEPIEAHEHALRLLDLAGPEVPRNSSAVLTACQELLALGKQLSEQPWQAFYDLALQQGVRFIQLGYRAKVLQALADVDMMSKKLAQAPKTPTLETFLANPSRKRLAKYFQEAYMDRLGEALPALAASASSADLSALLEPKATEEEAAPPPAEAAPRKRRRGA